MYTSIGFFASAFSAIGGITTTVGPYTVHTFTASADFTVTGTRELEVFLVGAGGAGRPGFNSGVNSVGGGGGGGGAFIETSAFFGTDTYSINVGLPSTGYPSLTTPAEPSTIVTSRNKTIISAAAGGIGGTSDALLRPPGSPSGTHRNGLPSEGSGGGGAFRAGIYGSGGTGGPFGNNGAPAGPDGQSGGGGGGAGSVGVGEFTGTTGSLGGDGLSNDWRTGTASFYAGGGGGGYINQPLGSGAGGLGGGGRGHGSLGPATTGSANTGGGGGGGLAFQDLGPSRAGGSGIVIIRYLTNP